MAGFNSPNYTQAPNVFFDEMIAQMGEAELRVALVIMRETFGWHRQSKLMSLSYLMKATGMSKQGVLNGITDGIARGIICQEPSGNSYKYSLVVNEVDQNARASQRSRPLVVNEVDHLLVNEVDTTNKEKESIKESPKAGLTPGERERYADSVLELLRTHYKSSPIGNVSSPVQVERRIDEHVDLIEAYGWEEYVRAANVAVRWKDIRYASAIEAQIVRDKNQAETPTQPKPLPSQWGKEVVNFKLSN